MWVTEVLNHCHCAFFINSNMFFVGNVSGRNALFYVSILDKLENDDSRLTFDDWRFKLNSSDQIESLVVKIGDKWGTLSPAGAMLVPTRYNTPEAALAALSEREKATKPIGMSDIDYMISQIRQMIKDGKEDQLLYPRIDWGWYDRAADVFYYTIEGLPWGGPYMYFGYDYEPTVESENEMLAQDGLYLGVENGVLSNIQGPGVYSGTMFRVSQDIIDCLRGEKVPVEGSDGSYFYSTFSGMDSFSYSAVGLKINKDGSYQLGHFYANKNRDGSYRIGEYRCAPGDWDYYEFINHYWMSMHNKGIEVSDEDALKAFREQICTVFLDGHFNPVFYDDPNHALVLYFNPSCYVLIPMSKSKANKFMKEFEALNYDCDEYVIRFDRKVDDDRIVYIDNLYIKSPSKIEIEYHAQ